MSEFLEAISAAIEGPLALALLASFVWGVLSVLLSPCHLASIPLVVAVVNGQGSTVGGRRALALSAFFAGGILLTIAVIGAITALAGRLAGDMGGYGNYLVAIVLLVIGLHLIGALPLPWSGAQVRSTKRTGLLAAAVLGVVFGTALGPCTFAYLAPMLAVTFKASGEGMGTGAALLSAFAIGHGAVIILAGASTAGVQKYLSWTDRTRGAVVIRILCGLLLVVAGLYLLYTAPPLQ